MAADDAGERTEQPTARRLEEARAELESRLRRIIDGLPSGIIPPA